MLRIVDGINYKEFYKYGFKRSGIPSYLYKIVKEDRNWVNNIVYYIDTKAKTIEIYIHNQRAPLDNTLFDLIINGLIEKVEENK